MQNGASYKEWLKQSTYDFETAEALFNSERFVYAVFMAHLAVEKALKGVYVLLNDEVPPKTHNLVFLTEICELNPPEDLWELLHHLSDSNIFTRYPEELDHAISLYNSNRVRLILDNVSRLIQWIKKQL